MGEFVIRLRGPDGRLLAGRHARNVLAFEGTERLLRRIFPPLGPAIAFKLGLSGAFSHTESERPNHNPDAPEFAAYDGTTTLSHLTNPAYSPNEGGVPGASLVGYARRDVAFTVRPWAGGARIETEEIAFDNVIGWAQRGDWSPDPPPRPWGPPWQGWEPEIGYPYQTPVIEPDALWDPDPTGFGAFLAGNLHRLGGFPINVVFLQDLDGHLIASAALMTNPVLWRPGSTLTVQYTAEIQRAVDAATHGCTAWFAEKIAGAMFQGAGCCSQFLAALVTNPPGTLGERSTYQDLALIEEAGIKTLTSWTIHAASGLTPPYAYTLDGPDPWVNDDEPPASWPAATYMVVLADVGGAPQLAWYQARNPAIVMEHDDTLPIDGGVKFELAGL